VESSYVTAIGTAQHCHVGDKREALALLRHARTGHIVVRRHHYEGGHTTPIAVNDCDTTVRWVIPRHDRHTQPALWC